MYFLAAIVTANTSSLARYSVEIHSTSPAAGLGITVGHTAGMEDWAANYTVTKDISDNLTQIVVDLYDEDADAYVQLKTSNDKGTYSCNLDLGLNLDGSNAPLVTVMRRAGLNCIVRNQHIGDSFLLVEVDTTPYSGHVLDCEWNGVACAPLAPNVYCLHSEDVTDHKCTEACADGSFAMVGVATSGRCPESYHTVDKRVVGLQCPDGLTNLRYCLETALNVTTVTKGQDALLSLQSDVQFDADVSESEPLSQHSKCPLYAIDGGTCGQSSIDCKYRYAYTQILMDGTCFDQGYTVVKGKARSMNVPVLGKIEITQFTKPVSQRLRALA